MNLPAHEETTVRLLPFVYHSVDEARRAHLRGPSEGLEELHAYLHCALDFSCQFSSLHPGRVREVDDDVVC